MDKEAKKADQPRDERFSPPSVSIPKGGGAIKGIGEKFAANPVTGTGSLTIPLPLSPGRSGFTPALNLSYDSGSGNGPFGFGWSVGAPSITRRTDKGIPKYLDDEESDVFILSGAEDLVPDVKQDAQPTNGFRVTRYRPRIEGLFAKIERWTNLSDASDTFWRSISRDNVTTFYGKTAKSRIADPTDPTRIFSWLICQSYDDKGNAFVYEYEEENSLGILQSQVHEKNRTVESRGANRYLKRVKYGNRIPNRVIDDTWLAIDPTQLPDETWMFELVFDYGDGHYSEEESDADGRIFAQAQITPSGEGQWPVRLDPFSTYRAGFEVRTYRLCRRVLMFHHFPDDLGTPDYLVRSTEFAYNSGPIASFITQVTQSGYVLHADVRYLKKSLPPLSLQYSSAVINDQIETIDAASLQNLPAGADGLQYQWLDLDGEGLQGVLSEQQDAWYYKRNLSPISIIKENGKEKVVARLAAITEVETLPSMAEGVGGRHQFLDLAGDGNLDMVQFERPVPGFFERTNDDQWASFIPFGSTPNLPWNDPNLKFIDLTGDGHADVLLTEGQALTWYPSLAEEGFGRAIRIPTPFDEEKGPAVVFADGTQTVVVADLSGDGLSDIVRIRNGEICYWPNLGYGRFGPKVTMDNAPRFDDPDQFDQKRVRLVDIDGSGTTDIIYLERHRIAIYRNECGNAWSGTEYLEKFPAVDNLSSVMAVDLLGIGTACLVWSSPLPGHAPTQMRYIDLMGGQKPHLLTRVTNNLGAETVIEYAPSTKFYLADKLAGKPWITRLPFPVHVVQRVETYDLISRNRFVTRYEYHHGYFDGIEREFRGFGMVEQFDTEEFAAFVDPEVTSATNVDLSSHVPAVRTRTWFHTGAHSDRNRVSQLFAEEYYREPGLTNEQAKKLLLEDTILPPDLTAEEEREACRALKGSMLRQEVYADDGSTQKDHPYSVTEQNFTVRLIQSKGSNSHAVFFTHSREAITYHYERNPADPRISHGLTLDVDEFGNVLKLLAIGYGRRNPTDPDLTDKDKVKQTQLQITNTQNTFTNPIDDILTHPDDYRARLPAEARTYELTGFKPKNDVRFSFDEWTRDNFALLASAVEIPYQQEADNSATQKRLIENILTVYRKNDLTELLSPGELQPLALPGESYKLALTPGLLAQVFKRKRTNEPDEDLLPNPGSILAGQGEDLGGYVSRDGKWWIPSGRVYFDLTGPPEEELRNARQHFFLPRRFEDPFGQSTSVHYDDLNNLLVTLTSDILNNTIEAENNYRVLQPWRIVDPNRNRSVVAFDALGMVAATALMGKEGENFGDQLDASFETDLIQDVIEAFLAKPRERTNENESQASLISRDLLGTATTRIVYDLDRFKRSGEPSFAATLAREIHFYDPGGNQTEIQITFSYSDGFGHEIQKKIQAEPGPVGDEPDVNPRWVGSGWTIFNNKGKPVRQYEPFFSPTHQFQFAKTVGVSSILFYDPVERVVATLHPNHTYEKVSFDPWQQATYDVNDTVVDDPRIDTDIAGYVREYFKTKPADWQTWHVQRINLPFGDPEHDAAQKAAAHANTPAVAHFDALGRPFLTLADNGPDPADPNKHVKFATRVELDIEGNQRKVTDAKGRVVMKYDYDMLGNQIHQASMEAGERWVLNDVTGKPIRAWDSRGFTRRMTYDHLRRTTQLFVKRNADELLAERTVYGESQGAATNHRTHVLRVFDGAGVVVSEAYDFKGNLLVTRRELLPDYQHAVDWSQNPIPNYEAFTSTTTYDALNRPTSVTTPDNSIYHPVFNEANLLDKVAVSLRGAAATPFATNIDYNAKGQRKQITYQNGARTEYEYDRLTFRLTGMKTTRPAGSNGLASQIFAEPAIVQDLHYTYDPAGNITRIEDGALRTVFNSGSIEATCDYIYDATYRLIEARGREHIGQTAHDVNPPAGDRREVPFLGLRAHPNDLQAMRNYTEHYEYDEVGNFELLRHVFPDGNGWKRHYEYEEVSLIEDENNSNRLTRTILGEYIETYTYDDATGKDVHGCMTSINDMKMVWDFKDQLHEVELGGGGTAFYVYDAAGQRTRKVIESQNGVRVKERIYLGGYEIYREFNDLGANIKLERETLHVMDDKQRIALTETKTKDTTQPLPPDPQTLIRYQLSNHLGSASVELNHQAHLISYEEYHPYGTTAFQAKDSAAEVSLKRYRYTGMERDEETGFAYHGARYYIPWLGSWTTADRIGIDADLNLFVYCDNSPIVLMDLEGKAPEKPPTGFWDLVKAKGRILVTAIAAAIGEDDEVRKAVEDAEEELRIEREIKDREPKKPAGGKSGPKRLNTARDAHNLRNVGNAQPVKPLTPSGRGGGSAPGRSGTGVTRLGGKLGRSSMNLGSGAMKLGRGAMKLGTGAMRLAGALGVAPDPTDGIGMLAQTFAAYAEAREIINDKKSVSGFALGYSAALQGMSPDWVREKLEYHSANLSEFSHFGGNTGLAESTFNKYLGEGYRFGLSLSGKAGANEDSFSAEYDVRANAKTLVPAVRQLFKRAAEEAETKRKAESNREAYAAGMAPPGVREW